MWALVTLLGLLAVGNCRTIDDANKLLNFVQEELNSPLSVQFFIYKDFNATLNTLSELTVKFGQILADELNMLVPEYKDEALRLVTSEMIKKLETVSLQQDHILRAFKDLHLLIDYKKLIHTPIENLFKTIERLLKKTAKKDEVLNLQTECRNIDLLASELANATRNCTVLEHSMEIESLLQDVLEKSKISKHSISDEDWANFRRHYTALYFHLDSQTDKNHSVKTIGKFLNDNKDSYENKAVLLEHLLKTLDLKIGAPPKAACVPMEAYLRFQYDRMALLRFGDVLVDHALFLSFSGSMCAKLNYYYDPEKSALSVSNMTQKLAPIYNEMSLWIDSLLLSAWPSKEKQLISDLITQSTGGVNLEGDVDDFDRILKHITEGMNNVGSQRFSRQYIVTNQLFNGTDHFYLNCKPESCASVVSMGVQVVILRTKVDTVDLMGDLNKLDDFVRWVSPILSDDLKSTFVDKPTIDFVKHLPDQDVIIPVFENFTSVVILRNRQFWSGCMVQYALQTESDIDSNYVQKIRYFEDSSWSMSNCNDWIFLFSV